MNPDAKPGGEIELADEIFAEVISIRAKIEEKKKQTAKETMSQEEKDQIQQEIAALEADDKIVMEKARSILGG